MTGWSSSLSRHYLSLLNGFYTKICCSTHPKTSQLKKHKEVANLSRANVRDRLLFPTFHYTESNRSYPLKGRASGTLKVTSSVSSMVRSRVLVNTVSPPTGFNTPSYAKSLITRTSDLELSTRCIQNVFLLSILCGRIESHVRLPIKQYVLIDCCTHSKLWRRSFPVSSSPKVIALTF